jgi:hypothetical protein
MSGGGSNGPALDRASALGFCPRVLAVSPRVASRVAYLTSALHVVAGAALLFLLQPGLPVAGTTVAARLTYVTDRTGAWSAGWMAWHLAALALLAFYVALAGQIGRDAPLRAMLALVCAAAGLAADLGGQAIYLIVAPGLPAPAFEVAEDAAEALTAYVANGLYTVAGILLVTAGARAMPGWLVAASVPVWAAGLGMSAAALAGSASGLSASGAVLVPAVAVWTALMARWLARRAS